MKAAITRIAPILEKRGMIIFDGRHSAKMARHFTPASSSGTTKTFGRIISTWSDATSGVHWDPLLFRDYLIEHPEVAEEHGQLNIELASVYPNDRVAYTHGKLQFILQVTQQARAGTPLALLRGEAGNFATVTSVPDVSSRWQPATRRTRDSAVILRRKGRR